MYVNTVRSALVIRPAGAAGTVVVRVVKEALQSAGVQDVRVISEEEHDNQLAASVIAAEIQRVDMMVADVSRLNPNVTFELGYALALRKPIILLVNKATVNRLPIDMAGLWYLTYDPLNVAALKDRVVRAVHTFVAAGAL
jgi:hypothetical protein